MWTNVGRLLAVTVAFICGVTQVAAQQLDLSYQNTNTSTSWVIQGERTLVINGFDLTPLNLPANPAVQSVTLDVVTPAAGQSSTVVVYGDANGGDPRDSTLLAQQTVTLGQAGSNRVTFSTPVTITTPVIWVGFYLPVGLEFNADTSGASVLTYWGWTPGATFDLANLSSAAVFGPSDGSAPVNLDIGGEARITATIVSGDGSVTNTGTPGSTSGAVLERNANALTDYGGDCSGLLYDSEDIAISARGAFSLTCTVQFSNFNPTQINTDVNRYERRGRLYDIVAYGDYRKPGTEELVVPVTHCLNVPSGEIDRAVLGVAWGVADTWFVLPSVRYGSLLCAEVPYSGKFSYFVERPASATSENVDLIFERDPVLTPHPVRCTFPSFLNVAIKNNSFAATSQRFSIRVQDIHVRTGTEIFRRQVDGVLLEAGGRFIWDEEYVIDEYVGELHRTVITIDPDNRVRELNEGNNVQVSEYILDDTGFCPDEPPQ